MANARPTDFCLMNLRGGSEKQEAAKVYNIKAKQEYGEYAYLNNILYDVV